MNREEDNDILFTLPMNEETIKQKNLARLSKEDRKEENEVLSLEYEHLEKVLLKPYYHLESLTKLIVPRRLVKAFNFWLKVPQEQYEKIADIQELFENSEIILDDIFDNSELRRGKLPSYVVYGVARTVDAIRINYMKILKLVLSLGHPDAVKLVADHLLEMFTAQALQFHWRENLLWPSEENFIKSVENNTGGCLKLSVKLLQLLSDDKRDFLKITEMIGVYFRIRNDYINLCSKEYETNHGYCDDISEGKISFPAMHAVRTNPSDDTLINIIKQRPKDKELKRCAVAYMEKCGSFEYTRNYMDKLRAEIMEVVKRLGENPFIREYMDLMNYS